MVLQSKSYIFIAIGILSFVIICFLESNKNIFSNQNYQAAIPVYPAQDAFNHPFSQFENNPVAPVSFDLDKIKKRKKLIALTAYNTTSYFIYKGLPMGFEYELLTRFSENLGVELQMVVAKDPSQLTAMLNRGEGDIIADHLIVTREKDKEVNFTVSVSQTRQVLVQKKPLEWEKLNVDKLEKLLLRNPLDLIDREVYVVKGSPYAQRLRNLSEEVGGNIKIAEVTGEVGEEDLIAQVSSGKIEYTIADESLALINRTYYKNLDVKTAIGFPQRVAWAVRENSPELLSALNTWLIEIKKEPIYKTLYHKYYLNKENGQKFIKYRMDHKENQQISNYDISIIKYARELEWDWRLLASLIYQESRFDPNAKSWVGASGLMQLMPETAKSFGVSDLNNPEESMKAGISYIKWLDNYWKDISDKEERIKFIMASYNVGQAHVSDAQRLAIKYNKDPKKWDNNVADFVLLKSNPKYWNDPVVKYGYCRGKETFDYVNNVLKLYHHYKNFTNATV